MFHGQAGSAWSGFGATAPEGLKLAFFCQFPLILIQRFFKKTNRVYPIGLFYFCAIPGITSVH
ncbi:hypothetical protein ATX59_01885 [Oenococcus oeni]|uniref:Uncharacterized protein n=1 Tax=Oenococcus oeni TaxID=1247 RepID=A0A6N4A8Q9_OENOE|nr:hypothetical protein ATW61_09915 [Oenococcus oeni]OIL36382.1 hypothetical protein ATX10_01815 [Oenococcus oeni]OIM21884.1 hypothetical protein ATX59_01885 [Oenococcus oeni]OIM64489.1 hypothetical protein ATX87_01760 [Oenococcus oeni]